ncbi:small ribosomal subunit protein mS37-like isoform X2 [Palaemon carinicauda]|uniref:small ribosomal subunit protein mS37-like isoform X2 n=1 Tax=Palaemon carinicauda TaxID=392227 RepID=UPI0035B67325
MKLTPYMLTAQYLVNGVRPKNGRRPCRHPFPFTNILPISLRNHVSGKSDKQQTVACIQELSVMLACLKTHDFNDSMCSKEINNLKNCNEKYMSSQRLKKLQDRTTELTPYEKNLSHKHLNQLLKKYPQPK